MRASGPTCVSESKILKPSRAMAHLASKRPRDLSSAIARRKIALLQHLLFCSAFAILRRLGSGIGLVTAALDKGVPGLHATRLERGHEVPQRRPGDVVGEARIPGDGDAERQMLVEIEIAAELALHERKRPGYRGARRCDFVGRMGRLELHPVDAGLLAVSP